MSRVRIGPHTHPCACDLCTLCVCDRCVYYLAKRATEYQCGYIDREAVRCDCTFSMDAMCKMCGCKCLSCYSEGVLYCTRCMSISDAIGEHIPACMPLPAADVNADVVGVVPQINTQPTQPPSLVSGTIRRTRIRSGATAILRGLLRAGVAVDQFEWPEDDSGSTGPSSILSSDIEGGISSEPQDTSGDIVHDSTTSIESVTVCVRASDVGSAAVVKQRVLSEEREAIRQRIERKRLGLRVLGRAKRRPAMTYVEDELQRRLTTKVEGDFDDIDNELVYRIRIESALLPRDTSLPFTLKRKAMAWLRSERPGLTQQESEIQIARAIRVALSNGPIDDAYHSWLKAHYKEPVLVAALNVMQGGAYVPRRTKFNRFVRCLGFRKFADNRWLKSAVSVMPEPK